MLKNEDVYGQILLVSNSLASAYQKASKRVIEQPAREQKQEANVQKLKERERQIKQLALRAEQLRTLWRTYYVQTLSGAKASKWESHPWLIGTRQGVIDLRTGTLRVGRPEDRLRTIIPTKWKGLNEPAVRFQQFLRDLFADREEAERDELIAFLQRLLGYGITGHVNEHVFLMLSGEDRCRGKDTLMHVLEHVLGKTVGAVSSDLLLTQGQKSSPRAFASQLGSLQGKRIAWVTEHRRESRFAIEQVKQLTDGKALVARQLYTREYTFMPSHLLILSTTYQPKADLADDVFWERLCPLVLNVRFVEKPGQAPEQLRDPALETALEAEASGILAWLVRGALEWTRLGLAIPESVRATRQNYRRKKNTVQDFVNQYCTLAVDVSIQANQLYKCYKRWASDSEFVFASNKQFAREMKQIEGITSQRGKRGVVYMGICLNQGIEVTE